MALLNPAERLHLMNGLIVVQQLQPVDIQAVALLLYGRLEHDSNDGEDIGSGSGLSGSLSTTACMRN